MALRCFIAVEIPETIKKGIGEITDGLKKSGADVKWVPNNNIHITMKFLGDTEESVVDAIKDALHKRVSSYSPFYIKISGVGCFPSGKHPRVVWVGMEESGVLAGLWKDIEGEMTRFGYPEEGRPFSPHLTIGRVRSPKGIQEMMKRLDEYRAVSFDKFEIKGITLMKSELKPAGAEYYRLAEIPFGGRNDVD